MFHSFAWILVSNVGIKYLLLLFHLYLALVNLSLNKTVLASSQFLTAYPAGNAVDGITTNDLHEKSCMHTTKDKNPWIRIDLGIESRVEKVSDITQIKIHHRNHD